MQTNTKKCVWADSELHKMLVIIKEKFATRLLHNKSHRNIQIFEEISTELKKCGIIRTAVQIRIKYKCLKCDYKKIMKDGGNYNRSVRRHTKQHFELLDDIFYPIATHRSESNESLSSEVEEQIATDPLSATYQINKAAEDIDDIELEDETVEQIIPETQSPEDNLSGSKEIKEEIEEFQEESEEEFEVESEEEFKEMEEDFGSSTSINKQQDVSPTQLPTTSKEQKRESYQTVVENFTQEWKISQTKLMEAMERQDQTYLRSMEDQCKRQEEMLRKDREKMEEILKQDRTEMKTFFIYLLDSLGLHQQSNIE